MLAKLAGMIGDPAVRHMGTIGGSIANNDPNADYPAACLGLGATIITNKRRIKADDFFTGMFSTALEPTEIITKVSFPIPKKAAYQKFRNQASRFALVGVFVSKRGSEIRVAVTGAGANGVFRVKSFEEALKKRFSPKSLEGMSIPADGMNSRHPRQRRIPRPPGRRARPPGGRGGDREVGLIESTWTSRRHARPPGSAAWPAPSVNLLPGIRVFTGGSGGDRLAIGGDRPGARRVTLRP